MPVNVQHNCFRAECMPSSSTYEIQEHEQTQHQTVCISHVDKDHFILNTFALHNAHILAQIIPCHITQRSPLISDCIQHYQAIAQGLQEVALEKWELNKAKHKLTKTMHTTSSTPKANHKWHCQNSTQDIVRVEDK